MHCVQTAELASLLSEHGSAIVRSRTRFATPAVARYWATSRNRVELWHQALARYRRAEESGDIASLRSWWRDHVVVMEEVLVSEILTRVIAALTASLEVARSAEETSPITHAVSIAHVEASNRVQKIMLFGRGNSIEDAVRLNRLRQAVERWTDAMIGRMSGGTRRSLQFAFDSDRAAHYREDICGLGRGAPRSTAMWLMNASMRDTLSRRTSRQTALPEANRAVTHSVLLMLRPELFDSLGTLKSSWLQQLERDHQWSDRAPAWHHDLEPDVPDQEPLPDCDQAYTERWYQ